MTRRFLVEPPLAPGERSLPEAEAAHLATVLRARPGDPIELADGAGREADGVVVSCGKRAVVVRTTGAIRVAPRPRPVELWAALPRAGAADDVVRQATEAGATLVRPLLTERGVWRAEADGEERRRERFRRAAAAALKQCKAAWFPELPAPARLAELALGPDEVAIFGSLAAGARPIREELPALAAATRVVVLTGPEGGFVPEEEAAMLAVGARPVRLGTHVLRAETAVVALLAAVAIARG